MSTLDTRRSSVVHAGLADVVRPRPPSPLEKYWLLAGELFAVVAPDGRFHAVSPAWHGTLGWTNRELVGADPLDFVHPDDRRRAVEASEVARKTGRATGTAIRYRHVDTSYRCLSWSGYRARVGWHIFARDVSAARAIEVERL